MAINTLMQRLIRRIERFRGIDAIARPASGSVSAATRPAPVKNLLSGSWLGHQLHPILTDLPIGAWGAATALDLTAGEEGAAAARRLVGMGLVASAPTALAGASDWAETSGKDRRVGLVHGLMNAGVSVLQTGSWIARRRGHRGLGVALSLVAVGIAGVSAYLGGHLSYVRGVGVNHTAFQGRAGEWTDVAAESEIAEGELRRVLVDDVPVLLTRRRGSLRAISAVCSHAGGPLDEGTLDEEGCVTCPWHGSRFRLSDGAVERGPASVPQPRWEARVESGRVLLRSA
ncbi:Rieske 2Fe-2S domain-containing protein [Microbacterium sp. Marseille-Q6965]|uniref:Rieske 2Fe-2S domain-containing protein n=1 Tax=Microbacterium sp. Marseille-Q6965 TaxID=2965072 RepID=UPI0021B81438|nr:Rieske 2Fe-2S domain-containing protein [Microbacterium sp. Marseille-Q6965]